MDRQFIGTLTKPGIILVVTVPGYIIQKKYIRGCYPHVQRVPKHQETTALGPTVCHMILLARCAYATLVLLQFLLTQEDAVHMVILLAQFASASLGFCFAPPLIYRTPSI